MTASRSLLALLLVGGVGCGARSVRDGGGDADTDVDTDVDADSDTDTGSTDCTDRDGDGYGDGAGCRGNDPDDTNPCVPEPHAVGCPCDEVEPWMCYTGPPGTAGTGLCHPGMQGCVDGRWGPCTGEVLPTTEICDGVDNDCNEGIDEGCE